MSTGLEVTRRFQAWQERTGWRGLRMTIAQHNDFFSIMMQGPNDLSVERILPQDCHQLRFQRHVDTLAWQMFHHLLEEIKRAALF